MSVAANVLSDFSPKALYAMANSDSFINMYEGAVRSSKTVTSIVVWLKFVQASPHREFLMTGKTADTLYRNVIGGDMGIISILGKKRAKYLKSSQGGAKLILKFGKVTKICYCLGANDERAEGNLRGMTIAGWYGDEVTLYPESFVKQAINRMSLAGAQAFWTMNPDSPYHYIKTEFIDKAKAKGYRSFHFELDDNYSLTPRYKGELKKAYTGLWYKRMVLGLWVMADGVIYDMFNHETMVVDTLPKMHKYWVAIDYGTSNATTFLLFGMGVDNRLYVVNEYYHSGSEAGNRQKSPSNYSAELRQWLAMQFTPDGLPIVAERIHIDPSAEGFIVQLWQDGVRRVQKADNEVKGGIERVSSIISLDKFRVHRSCKHTLKELSSYVWDAVAQKKGEDKPVKKNDHCLDPVRYITNAVWHHFIPKRVA